MIMSDDREAFAPLPQGRGKLDVLLDLSGAKAIAAERDELRRRIQAVLDYVATLECTNCEHVHDEGDCGAAIPDGRACRCTWGPPDVTEEVRKLLAEPGRPAQPASDTPVDAAFEDRTSADSRTNTRTEK